MSQTLFFDLETKYSADDVGGWSNIMDMGMAVGVIYDTLDGEFHVYLEHEMPALIAHLHKADLTVGFNHLDFDLRVVAGSEPTGELRNRLYLELRGLNHFDILAELKKVLGHRLKLDSLARSTLEEGKSADGLQSLQWYKEGRMDLIIEYCKQDVDVTRRLFEFALEHHHLLYDSRSGIKKVALDWSRPGAQAAEAPSEQMSLFE
ncbi:MAG: ribonuclease H-like domain-containing protein [SAR324 cluster bacterium]|nr:ribonuclease H-like domain-containing protein [SAR324 cluster bacterium]MCH8887799.1 ribonuclease H-like domain-containing protein [SAR324 cluster bacterium]